MILQCDCKHAEQDKLHGSGRRVHNEMKLGMAGQREARCTVCEKTKTIKGKS